MRLYDLEQKLMNGALVNNLPFYNIEYYHQKNEDAWYGYDSLFREINFTEGYTLSVGIQRFINLNFSDEGVLDYEEQEKLSSHLLQATGEIIASGFTLTLGFWINDDKLYVDVNTIVDDLDEALMYAKNGGQLAIYDNKNNKEIFIKEEKKND